MTEISTVGMDIAKLIFQVEGRDASGAVVLRRRLRRNGVLKFFIKLPRCVVALEACATAHYWAREISAAGHDVRLIPPTGVKRFVKRGKKNDQVDAAACCQAVASKDIDVVPIKTLEQQAVVMMHGVRQQLVEGATALSNAIRGHLAEIGIIARKGAAGFNALVELVARPESGPPELALIRPILAPLVAQWRTTGEQIKAIERQIARWHKANRDSRLLDTIPQYGPIVASAFVAKVSDPTRFARGRQCAAWLGAVPSQHSTGGKTCLGPITKAGDRYLRTLLVIAGAGLVRRVKADPGLSPWIAGLLRRMPAKKVAVAVANKLARIGWAVLVSGKPYDAAMSNLTAA
jgi:transposase